MVIHNQWRSETTDDCFINRKTIDRFNTWRDRQYNLNMEIVSKNLSDEILCIDIFVSKQKQSQ